MNNKISDASPVLEEAPQFESELSKDTKLNSLIESNDTERDTPKFQDEIFENLPGIIKKGCSQFHNKRERDVFFVAALTIISGLLNSVKGIYDQRIVYPHLYSFIIAPPANGKSVMSFAKELGMPRHNNLILESNLNLQDYHTKREVYKSLKHRKNSTNSNMIEAPKEPDYKMLYIPGNTSAAAVIRQLKQSGGTGIICETEADTLSGSIKQDWGNYSDMLRKTFHHESISSIRKGQFNVRNDYIEVSNPKLSITLSGTPSQVHQLIPSSEDGLFSRFIYYSYKSTPEWRDVSPNNQSNLNDFFKNLSNEVDSAINYLGTNPIEVRLTEEQWLELNYSFNMRLKEVYKYFHEGASSIVKRLGLIQFKLCQIFTALRKQENQSTDTILYCDDIDFLYISDIIQVLLDHALAMYQLSPKEGRAYFTQSQFRFLNALPLNKEITRSEANKIGESIGIRERTVMNYLNDMGIIYIQNTRYGHYKRIK